MSVSDKLVQIAENMERVYEAGAKPYTEPFEISSDENGLVVYEPQVDRYPIKITSTIEENEIGEGYTSMTLCRWSGKNLFDYRTYPFTDRGFIEYKTGKHSSSSGSNYCCTVDFIPVKHLRGKQITLNFPPGGSNPGLAFYITASEDGYISTGRMNGQIRTTTVPENANFMRFSVHRDHLQGSDIQIEIGSATTDFESFNGKTLHLKWKTPILTGKYDWDTGLLSEIISQGSDPVLKLESCIKDLSGINYLFCSIGSTMVENRTNIQGDLEEINFSSSDFGYRKLLNEITKNGTRTDYAYGFRRWRTEYIRPDNQIKPSNTRLTEMFAHCTDLKKLEAKYFDLSGASVTTSATATTGLYNVFYYCENLEEVEDIGLPAGGYYQTFRVCRSLKKIHKLRVNENCGFSNVFNSCTSLEEISEIEGSIGQSGLDFSWSPLNKATITAIINALSATASEKKITLRQSSVNTNFTAEEWEQLKNTKENWTITLIDS